MCDKYRTYVWQNYGEPRVGDYKSTAGRTTPANKHRIADVGDTWLRIGIVARNERVMQLSYR
jgi:hypothetical protein